MKALLIAAPPGSRRTTPIGLGIAALLTGLMPAQTWGQLQPASRPSARLSAGMVFDAARDVTLVFGGRNWWGPPYYYGDTWTWDGANWAQLQPGVAPTARGFAGMAYDASRQRVVLFGGEVVGSNAVGDTWEWDGASWLQRFPIHAPTARMLAAMAYDAAHARTVLFGGLGVIEFLGDTWTWDGTDWTQLAPAHSPPGRNGAGMVYDSVRARCVLFGGYWGGPQGFADTWEWDGADWVLQLTAHAPSPRTRPALAFDEPNQRVVLFGGAEGDRLGDTWEYDGNDWVQQTPAVAPSQRDSLMVYDSTRANIVLFGGDLSWAVTADTWQYTHPAAATFTPFGQGCAGSQGMPQLARAGAPAIVGRTFQVACTNLQLDHFTTMWIGFSKTNSTLGSLPYDLSPLGMPGCTLFVSGDIVTMLLNWNGTAFWQMTIPNAPQLVGLPFYLQAGVLDHQNALGMVATNAAEVRVGDH